MDLGTGILNTKEPTTEHVSIEDVLDLFDQTDMALDADERRDKAVESVQTIIACVKAHGYEQSLEMLHGEELRKYGVDTDASPEAIVSALESVIAEDVVDGLLIMEQHPEGSDVSQEALIVIAIISVYVGMYVALIATMIVWTNQIKKLNLLYSKKWGALPVGEFDKVLATKKVKVFSADKSITSITAATKVLLSLADNKTKLTDISTLGKMAKDLGGELDASGKLTIEKIVKEKTTIGKAGWTNSSVEKLHGIIATTSAKLSNYDKVLSANIKALKAAKKVEFKGDKAEAKAAINATKVITKEAMRQYHVAAKDFTTVVMKSKFVRKQVVSNKRIKPV